ncbi:hypothetical protein OG369_10045 [Streptomyces sp. NBC_01221]|uniref:hypothetical protein n=1 Tax=Streptomyces sp. NBC_01221 TaxID=2903782 RepID=UPI00225B278A|nr:hypothetical protein [Streptomyces sp. NBC_01221]MCX4786513.1 hypothetical protein [Streptomyces sp. NBC_01221]
MSTQTPAITEDTARHVLWHYGADGGMQPGRGTQSLMVAIDAADMVTVEKLRLGFPELVSAMLTAKNDVAGIAQLQKIAGCIQCTRCGDTDGPFGGAPRQPLCEPCVKASR